MEGKMKMKIYAKKVGICTLKEGVTLEYIRKRYPDAIQIDHIPTEEDLKEWHNEGGGCEAIDGCWVDPDGQCEHGYDSWLVALGWI